MRPINLIPSSRIDARRRRTHRRKCIIACTVYAGAMLGLGMASHVVWGSSDPLVADKLETTASEIERTDKTIKSLKTELDSAQATLKASRSIVEQPDWSALMSLLAAKAGDEVVLKDCSVKPRDPEPVARAATPAPGPAGAKPKPVAPAPLVPAEPSLSLLIAGIGRTQLVVSQFALRLEATHLFARVRLIETNREMLGKLDAVSFRIECSLDEPMTQSPAAAAMAATEMATRTPARGQPSSTVGHEPQVTRVSSAGPAAMPSAAPAAVTARMNSAPNVRKAPPPAATRPAGIAARGPLQPALTPAAKAPSAARASTGEGRE